MKLRNGKNTNIIPQIVLIQSFLRMKKVKNKYKDHLQSLHFLKKQYPHLFQINFSLPKKNIKKNKTTNKKKKKRKCTKKTKIIEVNTIDDDMFIIQQYENIKDLGISSVNGLRRSNRKNKQKQPERYVDENYLEIILEDSKIEEVLESGSDVDSDYKSEEDVNSDESDGEWNPDYSESDESIYSDLE